MEGIPISWKNIMNNHYVNSIVFNFHYHFLTIFWLPKLLYILTLHYKALDSTATKGLPQNCVAQLQTYFPYKGEGNENSLLPRSYQQHSRYLSSHFCITVLLALCKKYRIGLLVSQVTKIGDKKDPMHLINPICYALFKGNTN